MAAVRSGRVLMDEASQLANFLTFRPVYPYGVFKTIQDFCRHGPKAFAPRVVLDVGCGSGWNTHQLAKHFPKVVGVDYRQDEINEAKQQPDTHDNLSFHTKDEIANVVKDGTVDVVTMARTLGSLDHPENYDDVIGHAIKPGAVMAAYTHATCPRLASRKATDLLVELANHPLLKKHWKTDKSPAKCNFNPLPMPFPQTERVREFHMSLEANLAWVLYYVSTWVPYADHVKDNPESQLLYEYYEKLLDLYCGQQHGKSAAMIPVTITFPVELKLSRRPT